MTNEELWQLVEQWRKDNQDLIQQVNHFNVVEALQRKLHERGTTTSDHTGPHRNLDG